MKNADIAAFEQIDEEKRKALAVNTEEFKNNFRTCIKQDKKI
jgi:hypothetical protein